MRGIPVKWFKSDIVTGVADKPGDEFTAQFFGQMTWFVVLEIEDECIMATLRD